MLSFIVKESITEWIEVFLHNLSSNSSYFSSNSSVHNQRFQFQIMRCSEALVLWNLRIRKMPNEHWKLNESPFGSKVLYVARAQKKAECRWGLSIRSYNNANLWTLSLTTAWECKGTQKHVWFTPYFFTHAFEFDFQKNPVFK